ncbi:MAG: peptide ABC transporter substrate-binding protein [Chloroflexi bacterium]|nr:peptide ABC transporter substrate-binding protein [Chloroflexota bacterium]
MRKPLMALLSTTAIVFAACGGAASQAPTATTTPTEPPPVITPQPVEQVQLFNSEYPNLVEAGTDGGTIVFGDWQEANQFNPFYAGQVTEANVASTAWASLLVATQDYKYLPDLAAEIPTTENGGVKVPGVGGDAMTITWKLRAGLKWSDGQPLTCDDFKYAWEWVLDPKNVGVVTSGYEDITAFDCVSDTEIEQHWKAVYSSYLTFQVAPLPRHYLGSIPMADQVAGAGFRPDEIAKLPVSGAFKFGSVTPGQDLRMVRNDNYTSSITGKPAHLDTLIFKWYTDADAMIAGYRGGEIDVATDLQDSDLVKVADLGDQVSAIPALLYEFWRPNWSAFDAADETLAIGGCSRNPAVIDRGASCPVSDPAVRAAISTAIDKNAINERLLGNSVQLANTNILPGLWYFAEEPSASFDPEKSKATLEAAGWVDTDGDGIREKNGIRLKIELCTTTRQVRVDTLALGAAWLKDVGIETVVNAVSPADIFADYNESTRDTPCALAHSNFDIAEHAFSSSFDPNSGYATYHSSQFEPNGGNDAGIKNADLDKALDDVKNNVDFAVIRDAMKTFQDIYVRDTIEIPLYYRKNVDLHSPKLGNFYANPTSAGPTWNAVDWYVKG